MAGTLTFGAFECIEDGGDETWQATTLTESSEWGNPLPVEVAIRHLLQDGSVVFTQGYDNREVNLRIKLTAGDLIALADAEAALFAEIGKRNTLTWTPPVALAEPTVFDVVTSSLNHLPNDVAEVFDPPRRYYSVRLVCEPFGRSATEVVVQALVSGGTSTTTVDSGSSTSGWTGTGGTVNVVSGGVGITTAAVLGNVDLSLTRTGAITTSSQKYLQIDWQGGGLAQYLALRATADGVLLSRVAQSPSPVAGYTRTTFYVPAASVATLLLEQQSFYNGAASPNGAAARSLRVDSIVTSQAMPSVGTARQLIRSVDVAGSARGLGILTVEHETNALGDVLVYVWPDDYSGYVPACRAYFRTGGGATTTDASLVSGARDAGAFDFNIPHARLPAGRYAVMARVRSNTGSGTPANYTITAEEFSVIAPSGSDVAVSDLVTLSTTHSLTGTTWRNVVLGVLQLPSADTAPGSANAYVDLDIVGTNVQFDEVWLCNLTIGQLIACSLGTGSPAIAGSSNRLFINPATVEVPRPTLRRGFTADGSDSYYVRDAIAWEHPVFAPPRVNVFTATSNTLDAEVSLRHFPRFHTHATPVT